MSSCVRQSILHLITGLHVGGAELMLYRLLSRTDREHFDPIVISLIGGGPIEQCIRRLGISVYSAELESRVPTLPAIWRLIRFVRKSHPDLIQGWMYHGSLAAQIAGMFAPEPVPVVWGLHHSVYDLKHEKWTTATVIRLGAKFSHRPVKIVYVAQASALQHELLGYVPEKRVVIPNGFDTERFQPLSASRAEVRQMLRIPKNTVLIGLVARYHPMKDHTNFLKAAAELVRTNPDVHFVLAGRGVDGNNAALVTHIHQLGLHYQVHLLGERTDIERVIAALDIASLSSYSESFPVAVGEAMACGVPCVVTDVGDSPVIVGDTGIVVPPRDSRALAEAWHRLIELGEEGRRQLGDAARSRILEHYSIEKVVQQYETLYLNVLGRSSCAV